MNDRVETLLNQIEAELKMVKKEKNAWTTSEYEAFIIAWDVALDMIEESFNVDVEKYRNIL